MAVLLVPAVLLLVGLAAATAAGENNFTFNGFNPVAPQLVLTDLAAVTPGGLLQLTNYTKQTKGHAFFPTPFRFKKPSNGRNRSLSFSTSFVFEITPEYPHSFGHGIAFVLSPDPYLAGSVASQHLGLFSPANDGNSSNHIVAVEFDIVKNEEFDDISDNHVGIDVNSLKSVNATNVYYVENGERKALNLTSEKLRAWVDYEGQTGRMEITVAPAGVPRPETPLLEYVRDLSSVVADEVYVGFSASTGAATAMQYVLGWSFRLDGKADELDLSRLPSLPDPEGSGGPKKFSAIVLAAALTLAAVTILLLGIAVGIFMVRRRKKYAEVLEDWEEEYGPHRFSYKDLFRATRGFGDGQLLGTGGFGRVYRGLLRSSKMDIAVKRISHDSQQGMREFVSEIVSMGRLRHRNLVQLLGNCRRQGELLLVYDFMPNGSLDKFLFDPAKIKLTWEQRLHIVKGVASGLLYLHGGWEQVVVHRDIKASNVLLDDDLNGKLSDFGLARLHDHDNHPQTTRVVGTLGYMAPELTKTGKATTATDVYAFGAFLLEVACGRRPMEVHPSSGEPFLVDWVLECWKRGSILEAADPKLWTGGGKDPAEEIELLLKLGLLCSHPEAAARPTMRQVVQYLDGEALLPVLSPGVLEASSLAMRKSEGFDDFVVSLTYSSSSSYTTFGHDLSPSESFFSGNH
ncbi:hypothetical protein Taro_030514 [Colocasia esculenta]|uniref:non-specific serine/threonine protein kinase n=1 Tax=Colocasia esculenta TaxID=4460 RepID=A0A843VWD0_COLES|nr:hypothetical protein [Colocasia esculenta]